MPITVTFNGAKLRAIRDARGLSRKQLAELADVAPVALAKYETGGNASPGIQALGRLAVALSCTVEDFLDAART